VTEAVSALEAHKSSTASGHSSLNEQLAGHQAEVKKSLDAHQAVLDIHAANLTKMLSAFRQLMG